MAYSTLQQWCFPPLAGQTVCADFQGGALSSDCGVLKVLDQRRESLQNVQDAYVCHIQDRDMLMKSLQRFWQSFLKKGESSAAPLWPRMKKRPGVLYEIDQEFHQLYESGLQVTHMRDVVMRRLRYYSFPALLVNVASVAGDVCEVGCYRGLSAYVIANTLRRMGKQVRFHLCDSFAGLSEFSTVDRSDFHNMDRPEKRQKYICSLEAVQRNLQEFDFIEYHQGWIPEPFRALTDRQFCFVHIDVDLYQPTRESFEFFYPRLTPHGIMVFDDYGSVKFPGARQAIDECLSRVQDAFFVALPAGQAFLVKLDTTVLVRHAEPMAQVYSAGGST
jgi:O-methyltransferase